MNESELLIMEMRRQIACARLDFLRQALPLARCDAHLLLARSISEAVGEVSVEEGMAAFRRELSVPQAAPQESK